MSAGVSKEAYFEMCEALGSEPLEEEIPVEMDDFPDEVQEAIGVYYKMRDEWDTMNGIYLGKSFAGFADVLNILEIPFEDRKYLLEWITVMDSSRSKAFSDMRAAKESSKPKE
jgi:hypothetical protein